MIGLRFEVITYHENCNWNMSRFQLRRYLDTIRSFKIYVWHVPIKLIIGYTTINLLATSQFTSTLIVRLVWYGMDYCFHFLHYTIWKSCKKHNSTLEMDTFKVMLLLSYLALLDKYLAYLCNKWTFLARFWWWKTVYDNKKQLKKLKP